MRPREVLANWLLCATSEKIDGRNLFFCSDPIGGDGIIHDEATGETWPTEHVYVSQHNTGPDAKTLIIDAINHKQANGATYCTGKTLVVFLDTPTAVHGTRTRPRRAYRTRLCSMPYGSSASLRSRAAVRLQSDAA